MDHARAAVTPRERALILMCAISLALSAAAFLNAGRGVSTANGGATVGSADIKPGAINSSHIADNTINSADIRNNAVRSGDLRNNTIKAADIQKNAVRSSELAAYIVDGQTVPVPSGEGNTSFAPCRRGQDQVLAGGWVWFGAQEGLLVAGSQPQLVTAGWEWAVQGNNFGAADRNLQSYATCLSG